MMLENDLKYSEAFDHEFWMRSGPDLLIYKAYIPALQNLGTWGFWEDCRGA